MLSGNQGNSDASNLNQPQRNSVVTTNTKPQANSVITNNTQPQGNAIVTTNIQPKSSDQPVPTQDEQGRMEVLVSLDAIKKNPKLAELFAMKEMRKVFWGKGFSPAIKVNHNILAALITSRGTILKICGQCKIGKKGVFTECVAIKGSEACGNCAWNGEGTYCTHRSKYNLLPSSAIHNIKNFNRQGYFHRCGTEENWRDPREYHSEDGRCG